jgi:hypothetical protein
MPAAKSVAKSTAARTGSRIRVCGENAVQGKAQAAAAQLAEIVVSKQSLRTLRQHKGSVQKVLTTYADAIEKAEKLGRAFELVIKVHPDRTRPAVEEREARGDALDDALAAARQRGTQRVASIMKSPDMLSARALAPLIGASHETVNQKRKSGEILALDGTTRGLRYPKWQITDDGRLLPGLADLARELPGGPWTVYRFLLQAHPELNGMTGLEALKAGRVSEVVQVARGISQGTFA